MKILFVASEVAPFAKTGGLADVASALPKALKLLGHDVRLMMPRYRVVDPAKWKLRAIIERLDVPVGPASVSVTILEGQMPPGIPVYFVDCPAYFDRPQLYQEKGADYPDNVERFSCLSQAVLRACPILAWQPDVVHCHDWQASLVCAHLAWGSVDRSWRSVGTVLTVHNLAYQGLFPADSFPMTNLPAHAFGIRALEFYGQVNCLKGGLVSAHVLTTVSPTYAKEIQTPEVGCGLEGVLVDRRADLVGILNGIDPDEWNPKTDAHLASRYGVDEVAGKSLCKLALQKQATLPERHGLLIGMIQRLAEQKGIDLVVQAAQELLALEVQLVILGTGDPVYHEKLAALAKRWPDKLSLHLKFDDALAHQIEAGADAFLMPSRFEPCGLNQMYSMRYGTVPIVRRVGGLADTVVDVSPKTLKSRTATGFVFDDYSAEALARTVQRAAAAFRDHELWQAVVRTGMQQDFSWTRSAQEYLRVYARALSRARATAPPPSSGGSVSGSSAGTSRHPAASPAPR